MLSLIFNRDFSNGQTVFVKSIVLQRNTGNFVRINFSLVEISRPGPTRSVLGCSDFFMTVSIKRQLTCSGVIATSGHQNLMSKYSCQFYFGPFILVHLFVQKRRLLMAPKITNSKKQPTCTERQPTKLYKPKDEKATLLVQKRFSEERLRHGFWRDRTFNI